MHRQDPVQLPGGTFLTKAIDLDRKLKNAGFYDPTRESKTLVPYPSDKNKGGFQIKKTVTRGNNKTFSGVNNDIIEQLGDLNLEKRAREGPHGSHAHMPRPLNHCQEQDCRDCGKERSYQGCGYGNACKMCVAVGCVYHRAVVTENEIRRELREEERERKKIENAVRKMKEEGRRRSRSRSRHRTRRSPSRRCYQSRGAEWTGSDDRYRGCSDDESTRHRSRSRHGRRRRSGKDEELEMWKKRASKERAERKDLEARFEDEWANEEDGAARTQRSRPQQFAPQYQQHPQQRYPQQQYPQQQQQQVYPTAQQQVAWSRQQQLQQQQEAQWAAAPGYRQQQYGHGPLPPPAQQQGQWAQQRQQGPWRQQY